MFSNKHNATCESIQPIAGKGIPVVSSIRAHDLDDRVEIVASGRVHRHTGGLINDNEVVIFVNNANGLRGYGGFMAMESVGYYVAISNNCSGGGNGLAVEDDAPLNDSFFLASISMFVSHKRKYCTYVVLSRPVSEF